MYIPFFFLPPSPRVPFLVAALVDRGIASSVEALVLRVVVAFVADLVLAAALAIANALIEIEMQVMQESGCD